jgi:hypothetical protein
VVNSSSGGESLRSGSGGGGVYRKGTLIKEGGSWRSRHERVFILSRNVIKYYSPDDVRMRLDLSLSVCV